MACALASCNSSGCLDNGSAIPLAGFYSSATARGISLDSLRVQGIGAPGDSAMARPGQSLSQVYLPMSPNPTTTSWVIAYKYTALDYPFYNDTITFTYETTPYFASEECGAMYYYRLTGVRHTYHLIDSITVNDSLITNVNRENLKIFFRVAAEEGGAL